MLEGSQADTIIVAVLDNGAELSHKDLQGQFWVNPGEIPDNGIDDDKNGYVDDINGWNFIGGKDGQNMKRDTKEFSRLVAHYSDIVASGSATASDSSEYDKYQQILNEKVAAKKKEIKDYEDMLDAYKRSEQFLSPKLGTDFSKEKLEKFKPKSDAQEWAKNFQLHCFKYALTEKSMSKTIRNLNEDIETRLNPDFNARAQIVGDDPTNVLDTIYGNNQLNVKGPYHGTGCASIIGALRNGDGPDGVSPYVKLMILRVVPNGDERDKDQALAIKYAVDNGAKVISCSFGKLQVSHPEMVREAISYAEKHDVLIVVGAGNDALNTDVQPCYPVSTNLDGVSSPIFIKVGASDKTDNPKLPAFFSNYGKETVDIFAPGMNIQSCGLNDSFTMSSGTSDAAPVVAGVAAILMSYYPDLTSAQIKEYLLASVFKPAGGSYETPGDPKTTVAFSQLCRSGGVVNLANAVSMIESARK